MISSRGVVTLLLILALDLLLLVLGGFGLTLAFVVTLTVVLVLEGMLRAPPPIEQAGESFRLSLVLLSAGLLAARVLEPAELALTIGTLAIVFWLDLGQAPGRRAFARRTSSPISWRNLVVPGPPPPSLTTEFGAVSRVLRLIIPLLLAVAMLLVSLGADGWLLIVLCLLCVAAALAINLASLARVARLTRAQGDLRTTLRRTLMSYAPEVVVHLSGYRESTHTLNVWCGTLEQIEQRVLIVLRQAHHLEAVQSTTLPMVVLPRDTDLAEMLGDSVGVALYPLNNGANADLVDISGILDINIGHGDSDKAASANPESRIFDELWVAGPAGRDRYLKAQVGVRAGQIREVGRPQLAEIDRVGGATAVLRRERAGRQFTVLYAPTWEGSRATNPYSSLLAMGPRIVDALLSLDDVRVLYKAHPSTGTRDRAYLRADAQVRASIDRAGSPHWVAEQLSGLYQSFNDADLVISDVGSVITDFLRSGKPYIVTNPRDEDEAAFRKKYPSASGAPLLGSASEGLAAMIDDARTTDSWSVPRTAVASYLLGDSDEDPLLRFQNALSSASEIQSMRTARRRADAD